MRIARRAWLGAVLDDVARGTCSVLEHGYQALVVRPHGLPSGTLQAPASTTLGRVYRDLERDLDAAVDGAAATVRLGFEQVYGRSCRTAAKLGAVMNRLGWADEAMRCRSCRVT